MAPAQHASSKRLACPPHKPPPRPVKLPATVVPHPLSPGSGPRAPSSPMCTLRSRIHSPYIHCKMSYGSQPPSQARARARLQSRSWRCRRRCRGLRCRGHRLRCLCLPRSRSCSGSGCRQVRDTALTARDALLYPRRHSRCRPSLTDTPSPRSPPSRLRPPRSPPPPPVPPPPCPLQLSPPPSPLSPLSPSPSPPSPPPIAAPPHVPPHVPSRIPPTTPTPMLPRAFGLWEGVGVERVASRSRIKLSFVVLRVHIKISTRAMNLESRFAISFYLSQ